MHSTLSLPGLVDAIQHVRICGSCFCELVFIKATVAATPVPTPVILGNEPAPPHFQFPGVDPFAPSPSELLRQAKITARFF